MQMKHVSWYIEILLCQFIQVKLELVADLIPCETTQFIEFVRVRNVHQFIWTRKKSIFRKLAGTHNNHEANVFVCQAFWLALQGDCVACQIVVLAPPCLCNGLLCNRIHQLGLQHQHHLKMECSFFFFVQALKKHAQHCYWSIFSICNVYFKIQRTNIYRAKCILLNLLKLFIFCTLFAQIHLKLVELLCG